MRKGVDMGIRIEYHCMTDPGLRRSMNQDNFICVKAMLDIRKAQKRMISGRVSAESHAVFGVFDGMGGEECGEIASRIAAEQAAQMNVTKDVTSDVKKYCDRANQAICDFASNHSVNTMGTTAAMLVFTEKKITLCNIGDSKVFRFDNGDAEQISVDHLAAAPFGVKPPLYQNLGIPPEEMKISPHTATGEYNNDDIYLICSDGLTDMLSIGQITSLIRKEDLAASARALMKSALDAGGSDNITLILCKIEKTRCLPLRAAENLYEKLRIFLNRGDR